MRARAAFLLAVVIVTTSCAELVSSTDQVQVALPSQEELVGLVRAVNDAATRIAPSFSNPENAPRLKKAIETLALALNSADGPAAAKALDEARAALTAYQQAPDLSQAELPDLGAIDLSLIRVNGLLQRPCSRISSSLTVPTQRSCSSS